MHKIQIGIEHIACGLQIIPSEAGQVIQMQAEGDAGAGGSLFALVSSAPFSTWWLTSGGGGGGQTSPIRMESYDDDKAVVCPPQDANIVSWWAQEVAEAMRKAFHFPSPDFNGRPVSWKVAKAMILAHGRDARFWIGKLVWSVTNCCWIYNYCGVVVGVEEDGTRHT